jgi:hypothetical protein
MRYDRPQGRLCGDDCEVMRMRVVTALIIAYVLAVDRAERNLASRVRSIQYSKMRCQELALAATYNWETGKPKSLQMRTY